MVKSTYLFDDNFSVLYHVMVFFHAENPSKDQPPGEEQTRGCGLLI